MRGGRREREGGGGEREREEGGGERERGGGERKRRGRRRERGGGGRERGGEEREGGRRERTIVVPCLEMWPEQFDHMTHLQTSHDHQIQLPKETVLNLKTTIHSHRTDQR